MTHKDAPPETPAQTARRVTAAERIAFLRGYDLAEMSECRYQPTRFTSPSVYVLGSDYYCAPNGKRLPKVGYRWAQIGEAYGQPVFRAEASNANMVDD